ncbi:MAG: hypothetical protein C0513_03495 [Isosphaera sp.]|nr:hypothetical protein [Isosphaera sp.]
MDGRGARGPRAPGHVHPRRPRVPRRPLRGRPGRQAQNDPPVPGPARADAPGRPGAAPHRHRAHRLAHARPGRLLADRRCHRALRRALRPSGHRRQAREPAAAGRTPAIRPSCVITQQRNRPACVNFAPGGRIDMGTDVSAWHGRVDLGAGVCAVRRARRVAGPGWVHQRVVPDLSHGPSIACSDRRPSVIVRGMLAAMDRSTLLITTFGLGRLRPAPGTWGSVPPVVLGGILLALGGWSGPHAEYTLVMAMLSAACALICVAEGERAVAVLGDPDPPDFVADETAGMALVMALLPTAGLAGMPLSLFTLAVSFVVFRLCDIVKPWPCRGLERIAGPWGVLLDDLAAALWAALIINLAVLAL